MAASSHLHALFAPCYPGSLRDSPSLFWPLGVKACRSVGSSLHHPICCRIPAFFLIRRPWQVGYGSSCCSLLTDGSPCGDATPWVRHSESSASQVGARSSSCSCSEPADLYSSCVVGSGPHYITISGQKTKNNNNNNNTQKNKNISAAVWLPFTI
jgi:hypothetical protein